MNSETEKEMYKPQVSYEMCGDKVFLVIPQSNNTDEHRLVMTKDLFRACYEHWIKKAEDSTEDLIGNNMNEDEVAEPSDSISRKEAIKWIENWVDINKYYHPYAKCNLIPVDEVIDRLQNVPPAEKTGRWIDGWRSGLDGTRYWYRACSECGYERDDDDAEKDTNYCPNCGARMIN